MEFVAYVVKCQGDICNNMPKDHLLRFHCETFLRNLKKNNRQNNKGGGPGPKKRSHDMDIFLKFYRE